MRYRPKVFWCVGTSLAVGLASPAALAQDTGGNAGGTQVQTAPSQTTVTTYSTPPPGFPQPGAPDPNAHLPSSSRPTSDPSKGDGFDLGRSSGGGGSIRGNKGSSAILGRGGALRVPPFHTVRRGDTLSSIARLHGVSVDDLKQWNGLRSSRLTAGDTLTVRRTRSASASSR